MHQCAEWITKLNLWKKKASVKKRDKKEKERCQWINILGTKCSPIVMSHYLLEPMGQRGKKEGHICNPCQHLSRSAGNRYIKQNIAILHCHSNLGMHSLVLLCNTYIFLMPLGCRIQHAKWIFLNFSLSWRQINIFMMRYFYN